MKTSNDHVFVQLPTYTDFKRYRNSFLWCQRHGLLEGGEDHNSKLGELLREAYGDEPLPVAPDHITFTIKELNSVASTVFLRHRHLGTSNHTSDDAWADLRRERTEGGRSDIQAASSHESLPSSQPQELPSAPSRPRRTAIRGARPRRPGPAPLQEAADEQRNVHQPVLSASSHSPRRPSPLDDDQYEAVLQRLGAQPWLSDKELKARAATDADSSPPSWELLAAAYYASQDSVESGRRYGIPLTDVQWVERVREHAEEYFGERDNFEVLQLDDRPFPDTVIIAAALRANVPMRPDPLQVLRREQSKTDNSRVLQLQDSLRSIYQEFRSYKDNEMLRIDAAISKVAARMPRVVDDEEKVSAKKRKAPQASAAAEPSPARARTESPIPSSIDEETIPANGDGEVMKLLGDDLLFLFFMASNDSLERIKRGEQPLTDAEYLKHVSDQISASRHAEVKAQRRRAYDQLALSSRPFADDVVIAAYRGSIAQRDGAKVVTRAELVGLEKRITELVAARLQSGVRDLLTQTTSAVEQTLQSALQQMNAMNRKQMDDFLVSTKSSVG